MLIDTHCHLNDLALYKGRECHIIDAQEKGINKFIVVGWDKESSLKAIEISEQYPFCYAAIGVHPSNIKEEDSDISWIKELGSHKKVVAIGEIGLDYHWDKDNKSDQKEWFKKQIEIARELNKPIIVHTRDAMEDTFVLLKNSGYYNGVIHCYSGSLEMAKLFTELGFYLGIGGVVTFKNSNLGETLKRIGLDKIISETDSPYLAPVPHRGETNYPKYIFDIVSYISSISDIPFDDVEKKIERNVKELFNI